MPSKASGSQGQSKHVETWRRCEHTGDAILDIEDETGAPVALRVPWEHRSSSVGWGRRKRAKFKHPARGDVSALIVSEGKHGVLARDERGDLHALPLGTFELQEWAEARPLAKADKQYPDPPAGSRWITVNGGNGEGQAILIMPQPDGTHRVIGGAGGSMNHLRLRDVKSEETLREEGKQRRKDKAAAERERRGSLTKEEREAEKREKEAKKQRQMDAERKVVEVVREKWGNVDKDLDEADLEGLSEAAADRVRERHHRKQFRQAMKARKDIARILARERVEQIEDQAAVEDVLKDDPDLWAEANEAGQRELDIIAAEEESRKTARRPRADRADSDEKAERATSTARAALRLVDRDELAEQIDEQGGRRTKDAPVTIGETASVEARRRAVEAVDNALILSDAAEGKMPSGDAVRAQIEFSVITDALRAAGVDPDDDPETVRAVLANEARIALQRSQLEELRAQKFEELEKDGYKDKALKLLVQADIARGLTEEVRDATRRLGLRDDAQTPLKQAEIAELLEVLGSFEDLRKASASLDKVVEKAEPPKHDASRRAFYFAMSEPPDHVIESVEELVTRELAQRIVGLADHKSSAHAKAVADGHYAKLADISLAVSNSNHVDRSVVDAVGLKNAGILLRHALQQQGHEADDLHDALMGHHVREQKKLTADALRQADALVPDLEQHVSDAGGIEHALSRLDATEADIDAAQRAIGSALGQMEATATLAQTMRGKMPEHLSIELRDTGQGTLSSHMTWLASVGLQPGDYEIDQKAKEIRIKAEHWHKLINREPAEAIAQRKVAHAIKRGDHDEDGWLPKGMVSRSSSSFTDPPKDAPRYHTGLDLSAEDIHGALSDHIGSRLADGERPADILHDLLSPAIAGKSHHPEAFASLVRDFFPTQSEEDKAQIAENKRIVAERDALNQTYQEHRKAGRDDEALAVAQQIAAMPKEKEVKQKRDIHFADHYNKLAHDFLKKKHPNAAPMNAASLYDGVDEAKVRESVFRALADSPEHVAAFTPIGQLQPDHRRALQDHFYKRAGISEERTWQKDFEQARAELIDEINKGKAGVDKSRAMAAAGAVSMFGGPAVAQPKAEELSPENLGKLYPKQAKELAMLYPREGASLFDDAHSERPPEPTSPSKLSSEVTRAIEAVRESKPHLGANELAKAAAEHLGHERATKELGYTDEELNERGADGELSEDARHKRGRLKLRTTALAEQGIRAEEVHRVYGAQIHDAQREHFEDLKKRSATPWAQFVTFHGGVQGAYEALQAEMRGDFAGKLAEHYSKVTGKTLQTGIHEVPNADLHAQAISPPSVRKELQEAMRKEIDAARGRGKKGERNEAGEAIGGRFAGGSATEAYKQKQDAIKSVEQGQFGLFGGGSKPASKDSRMVATEPTAKRAPKPGERTALGSRIEDEIGSLVTGNLGRNMDLEKPVRLFAGASMDGRRIHQQRVIKMLRHAGGRLGAWLGTGSGKTPTSIGAFTDLHSTGDASHGLFLVPSAVQSQFGEEMLSFTEPGKYRFETGDGKDHAERAAMLRDKGVHMRVLTHESATKTVLKMAAEHHGVAPEAMLERLRGQSDAERAKTVREALDAHGVPKHMTYVDEAHRLTTRQGEQESDMSIIIGALSHPTNSSHALFGSATPHKNDASEVYSMARLLQPDRYGDAYRFTQRYGSGSVAAPDAIRRELDGLTYTASIPPDGVSRLDTKNPVRLPDGRKMAGDAIALHPEHHAAVSKVEGAYQRASEAARRGSVDVEATKQLNPSRFEGVPAEKHEAIARELADSLGIVKETAIRKALQLAPIEHNEKLRRMIDTIDQDVAAGKPSIVFTDSLEEAEHVHKHVMSKGIASGIYHGGLDGNKRDDFRKQFSKGDIKVGVMTSAGEAGINMQVGKVIHHYDVPKTMKSWSQRNGRAYRQGQKDDVDVHDWTWAHDYDESGARRLQDKGKLADVFQTSLGPLDEHGFAAEYNEVLAQKHGAFDLAAK